MKQAFAAIGLFLGGILAGGGVYTALTVDATTPIPISVVTPETANELELPQPPEEQAVLLLEPTEAQHVLAEITGAVNAPGVKRLTAPANVQDAIAAANGAAKDADLTDINIAAELIEGSTLYIPWQPVRRRNGNSLVARRTPSAAEMNPPAYVRSLWRPRMPVVLEASISAPGSADTLSPSTAGDGRMDLNTASKAELETLPGVGDKTAEKIIAHREQTRFTRIEELMDIPGIGDKKFEAVRNLVTVSGS